MSVVTYTKFGDHRGSKRIWLEGFHLRHGGIEPEQVLHIHKREKDGVFLLRPKPGAKTLGTVRVSRRKMTDGRLKPVIEIKNSEIIESMPGVEKLRVVVFKGKVTIRAHMDNERIQERERSFLKALMTGEALQVGSLFHGAGLLDASLHKGLSRLGIASYTKLAVEWDSRYLGASYANSPEHFRDDSILINGPIQDSVFLQRLLLHILTGGVPCVGASKSGISKNQITHAEEHDQAGAMFFYFLRYIETTNPALVVLENVPEYSNTASMAVIRSVLQQWGYTLRETILNGNELGTIEDRNRMCLIATSKGLDHMNLFPKVRAVAEKPANLAAIMDEVPDDDDMWKPVSYLHDKAEEDAKKGNGFKMQLLTPEAEKVGTIGRGYNRQRSTEPRIVHPALTGISRLLTIKEHARAKGVPEHIVSGLAATPAHEVLGQGVCLPAFEAVFVELGIEMLTQIGATMSTVAANDEWYGADIIYIREEEMSLPQMELIDLHQYRCAVKYSNSDCLLIRRELGDFRGAEAA